MSLVEAFLLLEYILTCTVSRMLQDVALMSIRLKPLSKAGEDDIVRLENVVKGKAVRETEAKMGDKMESNAAQEIAEGGKKGEKVEEKTDVDQKKMDGKQRVNDAGLAPPSTLPNDDVPKATEPSASTIDPPETHLSPVAPAPTSVNPAPRALCHQAHEAIALHPDSRIQSEESAPSSTSSDSAKAAEIKTEEQVQEKLQAIIPVVEEATEKIGEGREVKYKKSKRVDNQRERVKSDLEKTESEQENDVDSVTEKEGLTEKDGPIDGEQALPASGPAEDQQALKMPIKTSLPSFSSSFKGGANMDISLAQAEAKINSSNDPPSLADKLGNDCVKDEDTIHTPPDKDVSESKEDVDNGDIPPASEGGVEDVHGEEDKNKDEEEQDQNYQKDEDKDKNNQGVKDEVEAEEKKVKDAKSTDGSRKKKNKNRRRQ